MKKYLLKVLVLSTLFAFVSCANDAKKSYEKLRSEYEIIFANNNSYDDVVGYIERIDNHMTQHPSYEGNEDLRTIKKTLIKRTDELVYEAIQASYEKCYGSRFKTYDEARERFTKLRDELNLLYTRSETIKNREQIEKYLREILNSMESIAEEREDYANALAAKDVESLEAFLEIHPNSIMQENVKEKLDDMNYTELISTYNRDVETIDELNMNMKLATDYLYKFHSVEMKNSVSELISYMETLRKSTLQKELVNKQDTLFEEMEEEAAKIAQVAFNGYTVESVNMISEQLSEKTNSSTYNRRYRVKMYKEVFGYPWRNQEVVIGVEGRIQGDLQNGVLISVKGNRIG